MNKERFRQFAQILIFYTLLVILWGAWVRISHSGDGCGNSWPKCQGEFVPDLAHKKTFTEYFHRLMSGFYGIWVFGLFAASWVLYPKKSLVRKTASLTFVFMIIEALLGAKLVLLNLVGQDASFFRAFAMSLHQINSLLLTGSTFLLYRSAQNENQAWSIKPFLKWPFIFILLIAISGAWAALSTTLFPSESLLEGLQSDFQANSHFLVKLRILHPLLGILLGGGLAIYFYRKSTGIFRQTSLVIIGTVLIGFFTLLLKSPLVLKLSHLLFVHLTWLAVLNQAVISLDSNKR